MLAFGKFSCELLPFISVSVWECTAGLLGPSNVSLAREISVVENGDFKVSSGSFVAKQVVSEGVGHVVLESVDHFLGLGSVASSAAVLDLHVVGSVADNFVCHLQLCFF